AVLAGRVCVVGDDGALRVLVHAAGDASFPGADSVESVASFGDARLYRVRPARDAKRLRVEANGSEATMEIRWDPFPAWYTEARALAKQGKTEQALEIARQHRDAADGAEASVAIGQAARFEIVRGHVDESVKLFREAIPKARAAGRISGAVDDAIGLAFALS